MPKDKVYEHGSVKQLKIFTPNPLMMNQRRVRKLSKGFGGE